MDSLDTDIWDRSEEEYTPEEYAEDATQSDSSFEEEEEMVEMDDDFFDESEKTISVVDNARIRLEQGRLYEMLIKHNLFEGVDAMPQAVNKVQSEIKEFIVERLEILLGMRAEKEKEIHHVVKESQFNEVEVQALKMIARKVTKGASDNVPEEQPRNELNSVRSNTKAPQKLQNINKQPQQTRPQQVRPQPKQSASLPQKQMKTKAAIPVEKKKTYTPAQSNVTSSVEELAKKDIKYIESLKKMSLEEAGKLVAQKYDRPRSTKPISQESVNNLYTTKMSLNREAQAFTALLAAAKKK